MEANNMSEPKIAFWKAGKGKNRSFKDLKISLEKIEKEFKLLQDLSGNIIIPDEENPEVERALRDSFLIHFRRIQHFLYARETDGGTITAEDYFETGEKWKSMRIKETKIIKDVEKLANKVILSFAYGDDELILGKSSDDFKEAVDEIGLVFYQFIELNFPVETPEEETIESDDLEEIQATEVEVEVVGKKYGVEKDLYKPVLMEDGYLEVQVLHTNKEVRNLIENHMDDPEYFLDNLDIYKVSKQTARKWLAEIVMDYRSYFEENKVTFVMIE
jgi:hypothetical protein